MAVAVVGILLGLTLEGGKVAQIMQPTAAMIVFGGTLGAVMMQFPLPVVLAAFRRLGIGLFRQSARIRTSGSPKSSGTRRRRARKASSRSTAKWRRSRIRS